MTEMSVEFRYPPDDRALMPMQPCTNCGAPGHWSDHGFQGYYAAPNGHTIRTDGTLECPRALVSRS